MELFLRFLSVKNMQIIFTEKKGKSKKDKDVQWFLTWKFVRSFILFMYNKHDPLDDTFYLANTTKKWYIKFLK